MSLSSFLLDIKIFFSVSATFVEKANIIPGFPPNDAFAAVYRQHTTLHTACTDQYFKIYPGATGLRNWNFSCNLYVAKFSCDIHRIFLRVAISFLAPPSL